MRPHALLALLVAGAFLSVASLRAQERTIVHVVDGRKICSVHIAPCWGATGGCGLTFVRVEAENHDSEPHRLQVSVSSHQWDESDIRLRRAMSLGPEERARFFLPLPWVQGAPGLEVVIDNVAQSSDLGLSGRGEGLTGLLIADRTEALPQGLDVLQAMPSSFTTAPVQVHCRPADLPADWRLFTGFHVVVVEGRSRIDGDVQEALRRFVFGGGTLVVEAPERLPAGALRDLCASVVLDPLEAAGLRNAPGVEPIAHGLGLCCVIPAFGGDTSIMRNRLARLPRAGSGIWPMRPGLCTEQPVPGLGRAPVLAFLLVILLFAVLVGPVNFIALRRLRRPMLALVTVPALGFSTTALMLGYGLFYDGFGARGVVSSWTVLDQDRHECAVIAARTLFSGLSPGGFPVGPDALLLAPRAFQRMERRGADRWHLDENGTLDGGLLPSRTATPLLTGQQGVARQRLRVRQGGDDELQLLTDGGVEPSGEVVLRDPAGDWWIGTSPTLRRVAASAGEAALQLLLQRAGSLRAVEPSGGGIGRGRLRAVAGEVEQLFDLADLCARCMGGTGLRPGGYVVQVARAPWLDEHGLSVAYDAQTHFVFGRMQAQDFVR